MPTPFSEYVLYCDNHLLVVCKPAGMPSQRDRTGDPDLLTVGKGYLKERFDKPGRVFLGLVHRLDRPASGVMVLARTSKAASRLGRQFLDRDVVKQYVALVEGTVVGQGTTEAGYLKKSERGVVAASRDEEGAQYAELEWEKVKETARGTLVNVRLETGRKHQIRHQLARIGHPIVGDLRYGATREFDGRNLALHCYSLTIDHPTLRQAMSWQALPPLSWGREREDVRAWVDRGSNKGEWGRK
jgi:RluA family pseudouridine synthase